MARLERAFSCPLHAGIFAGRTMRKALWWLGGLLLLLGSFHNVLNALNTVVIDLVLLCGNVENLLTGLEAITGHIR
jgi:hypothetical protein